MSGGSAFGQDVQFMLDAIWKVLIASLILGAGLPMLFAFGIRSLAWGQGGDAEMSNAAPNPWGRIVAIVLFAIVVYGMVVGIMYVVATGHGNDLSISHVWPQIITPAKH